jgi:hypothetical protein
MAKKPENLPSMAGWCPSDDEREVHPISRQLRGNFRFDESESAKMAAEWEDTGKPPARFIPADPYGRTKSEREIETRQASDSDDDDIIISRWN